MNNFDFEAWLKLRFMPSNRFNEPQRVGTFVISEKQLLIDLSYRLKEVYKYKSKKATTEAKRLIKASTLLAKCIEGYFLKGLNRVKLKDGWKIIPYEINS